MLIGENGQGKTNLLEAIYFLSVLRSFRCHQVKNLFSWGHKNFSIKGVIREGHVRNTVEVRFGEQRQLLLNGTNVYKTSELLGQILCVAFVPEDLKLIRGTGKERRRFLDTVLSVLYPQYLSSLQDYYKILKSRNALLKRVPPKLELIESFDKVLVQAGAKISFYRTQFCRTLEQFIADLSNSMFPKEDKLRISYNFSYHLDSHENALSDIETAFGSAFRQNLSKDIDYQLTHVGPHRENFAVSLNNKVLQDYGSEGQCRLAVLILKMATGKLFLKERHDETIVFLVDDVTGELDKTHQRQFFELLNNADQVFFACTDKNNLSEINSSIIFEIRDGTANIRR